MFIIDEKEIESKLEKMEEKDRPGESKVGQRRVLPTWAVDEAWEQF